MKRIFIRVKKDDIFPDAWMITSQTEGFPETTAFLDDDLTGLHGTKEEMYKLAEEVRIDTQKSNPDMNVIIKRLH